MIGCTVEGRYMDFAETTSGGGAVGRPGHYNSPQSWRRGLAVVVLIVMFLIILALSVVFMYAAIHPNGLVIFSTETTLTTSSNSSVNDSDPNGWDSAVRPTGVAGTEDPWWIHLNDSFNKNMTRKTSVTREYDDFNKRVINYDIRMRVKMPDETAAKPTMKPPNAMQTTQSFRTSSITRAPSTRPAGPANESSIYYNYNAYNYAHVPRYIP